MQAEGPGQPDKYKANTNGHQHKEPLQDIIFIFFFVGLQKFPNDIFFCSLVQDPVFETITHRLPEEEQYK